MSGPRVSIVIALLGIAGSVFVTMLPGAEPDDVAPLATVRTSVEKAIEKALSDKKVSLDAEEQPLSEFVDALRKQTNITIVLDVRALDDAGIGADTPATIKIANISLRSALRLLFRRIDPSLSYAISDEALVITTQEATESNLMTRVYEVRDLVTKQGAQVFEDVFPLDDAQQQQQTTVDSDPLIELITATVEPDYWDEVGGAGAIASFNTSLVVSQPLPIQEEVAGLLECLRSVRTMQQGKRHGPAVRVRASAAETEAVKSIRKALDRPIKFDFDEMQLVSAVGYIRKVAKVPLYLDTRALDEIGIGGDTLVTFQSENRSLRSALNHLLRKIDSSLTFTAQDEVLMITTRETAEGNLILMVYPVLDLVTLDPADKWDVTTYDFDSIIEMLLKSIEPHSWDEVGGPASIGEYPLCGALVIAQTMEIHEKIAGLLSEIRTTQQTSSKQAQAKADQGTKQHKPANKDKYVVAVYHLDEWDRPEKDVPARPLVELIQETIEPQSWQSDEASIRILANRLVVRQEKVVHQEIYELLMKMNVLMEDAGFESKATRSNLRNDGVGFGAGGFGSGKGNFGGGGGGPGF